MKLALLCTVLLAAFPARASTPDDFAWGFPLVLSAEGSAWQIELPPEVYAASVDPELGDIAAFDAAGKLVPLARWEPGLLPAVVEAVQLPLFPVHRAVDAPQIDLRLLVQRGADRSLQQVAIAQGTAQDGGFVDYLLDASHLERPIERLDLAWSGAGSARFAVEASDDLEHWRVVVASATVLQLEQADEKLQRRHIPLPPTAAPYLRLRALDAATLAALRVGATLVPLAEKRPIRRSIDASLVAAEIRDGAGRYTYELPGSFDVERLELVPASDRALAQVNAQALLPDGYAQQRASFTLLRAEQDGTQVTRTAVAVGPGPRARRWLLESRPALDAPPRLTAVYEPDRFVVLLQGEGPWLLAAGSSTARRADAPIGAALTGLRDQLGEKWEPPFAALGERRELGGNAVLAAPVREVDWKSALLWAVLAIGAGAVAWIAVVLLRSSRAGA